jgi:hypothetical protein
MSKTKHKIALIFSSMLLALPLYPVSLLTFQKLSTTNRGNCTIPNASSSVFEMNLDLIRQKCGLKIDIEQKKPLTNLESKVAALRIAEVIRHNNLVSNRLPFAKIKTLAIYQDKSHRRPDSNDSATYSFATAKIKFHGQSDLCNTTHELYHSIQRGVSYSERFYDSELGSKHFRINPSITSFIFGSQTKLALSQTISDDESVSRFSTKLFSRDGKSSKTESFYLELGSYLTSQFTVLPITVNPITLANLRRLVEATSISTGQEYYSSQSIQMYYLKMGHIQANVTSSIALEKKEELSPQEQELIEFTIQYLDEMYNELMTLDTLSSKDFDYNALNTNLMLQFISLGFCGFIYLVAIMYIKRALKFK